MAKQRPQARLHGLLVIDKPAGWTSHDVVGRIRRLTGERQVGHAGTLDPMATGVLPVAVGDGTRAIEYLANESKSYEADIVFGVETDTQDADGRVTALSPIGDLNVGALERTLALFRGPIEQIPPMHAASKIDGVKLYELARKGITVERAARSVVIHELELLAWNPPVATIHVHCSKGFYVRALARDLGETLGVGAHLGNLVRLSTGPFTLCDAWSIGELEQLSGNDFSEQWSSIALHPDAMLQELGVLIVDDASRERWRHGMSIVDARCSDERVSVYALDGEWLGIGRGDSAAGRWAPEKVVGIRA
jgi:tRNA pseudouridine55 synthase